MSPPQPKPLAQAKLDLPAVFDLPAQPNLQSSAQLQTDAITDPIRLTATERTMLNVEALPKEKEQTQITLETVLPSQNQAKVHALPIPGVVSEPWVERKPFVLSPTKPNVNSTQQSSGVSEPLSQPTAQSQLQTSSQSVTEIKLQSLPPPMPPALFPSQTQQPAQSQTHQDTSQSQSRDQLSPQTSPKRQPVPPLTPQTQVESPDLFTETSSLEAPSQGYTEAYLKAKALARNHFEEAKHCLQGHIMEAIFTFSDKCLSAQQASKKEVGGICFFA